MVAAPRLTSALCAGRGDGSGMQREGGGGRVWGVDGEGEGEGGGEACKPHGTCMS